MAISEFSFPNSLTTVGTVKAENGALQVPKMATRISRTLNSVTNPKAPKTNVLMISPKEAMSWGELLK